MATRLVSVVFDAADPAALARFWADALEWEIVHEAPDEVEVAPSTGDAPTLTFVPVARPGRASPRVHLDLASTSLEHQRAQVARLTARGAAPLDVGQRDVSWEVLADPEGNAFCVLEPRATYADTGALAAVLVATEAPAELARFWVAAAGWPVVGNDDGCVSLRRADGRGPFLELLAQDPGSKTAKNPVHLDVAPYGGDDQAVEVERLVALGARPADVGQGGVTWVVLADPAGNEFCVLSPRD